MQYGLDVTPAAALPPADAVLADAHKAHKARDRDRPDTTPPPELPPDSDEEQPVGAHSLSIVLTSADSTFASKPIVNERCARRTHRWPWRLHKKRSQLRSHIKARRGRRRSQMWHCAVLGRSLCPGTLGRRRAGADRVA